MGKYTEKKNARTIRWDAYKSFVENFLFSWEHVTNKPEDPVIRFKRHDLYIYIYYRGVRIVGE